MNFQNGGISIEKENKNKKDDLRIVFLCVVITLITKRK